MLGLDSDLI